MIHCFHNVSELQSTEEQHTPAAVHTVNMPSPNTLLHIVAYTFVKFVSTHGLQQMPITKDSSLQARNW